MSPAARDYTFTTSHDVDVADAIALYDSVGWTAYTTRPEDFPAMFTRASHVMTATDDAGFLVGLVRVVGDAVSVAVIQDLIVHPTARRHGLGSELLRRILVATSEVRQTYITTDDHDDNAHVIALYERQGFRPSPDEGLVTLTLTRPRVH